MKRLIAEKALLGFKIVREISRFRIKPALFGAVTVLGTLAQGSALAMDPSGAYYGWPSGTYYDWNYWEYPSTHGYNWYVDPSDVYSGGDPVTGYWRVTPWSFAYGRPPTLGWPYGYVYGTIDPAGDFYGIMVIRGNINDMAGSASWYMMQR